MPLPAAGTIVALLDLIPRLGDLGARIAEVVNNSPEVSEADKLRLRQRMADAFAEVDRLEAEARGNAADAGNA